MGWWKVQGSEDVVGDDVFSLLRTAAKDIAEQYDREMGRKPTAAEWERLITDALEPVNDDESLFKENGRPSSVTIRLGALGSNDR